MEFPSPCGDYGSSDSVRGSSGTTRSRGFRPLAGITGLRTNTRELHHPRAVWVSVPLRGLRVFGLPCEWCREVFQEKFPSPCGDYGSSDSFCTMWSGPRELVSVPLRGLRAFGLSKPSRSSARGARFRPLAGITGLRTFTLRTLCWKVHSVSVPLRGLRVFGLRRKYYLTTRTQEFPSPCGDYGSSDPQNRGSLILYSTCFRPLAGITGLRTHEDVSGPNQPAFSFRPLAGITGLRTLLKVTALQGATGVSVPLRGLRVFGLLAARGQVELRGESFRPLAGITGLRTGPSSISELALTSVSVPLRGLRVFGRDAIHINRVRPVGFPSPCGDYGSSDSETPVPPTQTPTRFRPLAGITGLRTVSSLWGPIELCSVSVPLRGLRVFGH